MHKDMSRTKCNGSQNDAASLIEESTKWVLTIPVSLPCYMHMFVTAGEREGMLLSERPWVWTCARYMVHSLTGGLAWSLQKNISKSVNNTVTLSVHCKGAAVWPPRRWTCEQGGLSAARINGWTFEVRSVSCAGVRARAVCPLWSWVYSATVEFTNMPVIVELDGFLAGPSLGEERKGPLDFSGEVCWGVGGWACVKSFVQLFNDTQHKPHMRWESWCRLWLRWRSALYVPPDTVYLMELIFNS